MNLKDAITITLSVLAFILSGLAFYFNLLRTTDELSVVAASIPELTMRNDGRMEFSAPELSVVFINSGNRPTAILSFFVSVSQLRPHGLRGEECLDELPREDRTQLYETKFVPLVLGGNQIRTETLSLDIKGKDDGLVFPIAPFRCRVFSSGFMFQHRCYGDFSAQVSWYQIVARWTVSKDSDGMYNVYPETSEAKLPLTIYKRVGTIFGF